jgi:glycosyltransferase involved in cell wall biosynthesis
MSCGLPVVYSDTGGVPELVGVDAGLAVPGIIDFAVDTPPDPILLAHAMRNIMDDYVGYSTRARARAIELFDVREWLHRHATLFSKLANEAQ